MADIPIHSSVCDECGEPTFEFERYCHLCGHDRWLGTGKKDT